jgi:hypothetical protein
VQTTLGYGQMDHEMPGTGTVPVLFAVAGPRRVGGGSHEVRAGIAHGLDRSAEAVRGASRGDPVGAPVNWGAGREPGARYVRHGGRRDVSSRTAGAFFAHSNTG